MKFELPMLPYEYGALEPIIDEATMRLHHLKHHQSYIDNLNKALVEYPDLSKYSIEELLKMIENLPESIRKTVQNHGGGHANHSLFWKLMTSNSQPIPQEIIKIFQPHLGTVDQWKETFTKAALSVFGSGWAWISYNSQSDTFSIITTPNQDSPYMHRLEPILGLDVWEHAYYLKYQNRRIEYIQAWFLTVNWDYVYQRLLECKNK